MTARWRASIRQHLRTAAPLLLLLPPPPARPKSIPPSPVKAFSEALTLHSGRGKGEPPCCCFQIKCPLQGGGWGRGQGVLGAPPSSQFSATATGHVPCPRGARPPQPSRRIERTCPRNSLVKKPPTHFQFFFPKSEHGHEPTFATHMGEGSGAWVGAGGRRPLNSDRLKSSVKGWQKKRRCQAPPSPQPIPRSAEGHGEDGFWRKGNPKPGGGRRLFAPQSPGPLPQGDRQAAHTHQPSPASGGGGKARTPAWGRNSSPARQTNPVFLLPVECDLSPRSPSCPPPREKARRRVPQHLPRGCPLPPRLPPVGSPP